MDDDRDREGHREERFSEEELQVVRSAGLFDTYLGRGWFRGAIIYGIPVICALLIAAGIVASFVEVEETLLVYAQPAWIPGEQTGLRVGIMNTEGDFVPIDELEMHIVDEETGRRVRLAEGAAHGTQAASLVVVPPEWPAGTYALEVRARTTRRTKKASLAIRLDPQWAGAAPETTRELASWHETYDDAEFMEPGSPLVVELVPEGGQLASSLPNILYVRTTDRDGRPVAARVEFEILEGWIQGDPPEPVETDDLGLAAFIVYPTYNSLVMGVSAVPLAAAQPGTGETGEEVEALATDAADEPLTLAGLAEAPVGPPPGPRSSRGRIILPIGPQGVRLRPIVPDPVRGEPILLRVYSVGRDPQIFTDLYRSGVWLASSGAIADTQSEEVEAPAAPEPGLHVVQAYGSPVPVLYSRLPDGGEELASTSMSAAHVWVRSEEATTRDGIASLASILSRRGDDPWPRHLDDALLDGSDYNGGRALAFMLARLDGAIYPPGVAGSTREGDKRAAVETRERLRRFVYVAFAVVAACLVVAFGFLTFETWRSSKARAGASGARVQQPQDPLWLRKQVFQMAMIIAIVAGTMGLLAVLVAYLRWTLF